ncbi:MAG: tyrosine-type recombinase/integrase [Anaerolineae bacterium]|nr:tyrosine-type recombinase/integrase [Anaerolineae bacterium]
MSPKVDQKQTWALASIDLQEAFTDFILSRQAMMCTPQTIRFYRFVLGKGLTWFTENGATSPDQITARLVRAYLAELAGRGLSDSYIHGNARAIRTFVRFLHTEGYSPELIKFEMPAVSKKRLPALTGAQVKQLIASCASSRDKALILFMVDTGVRRAELCALNWGDVDISSGLVRILKGKGNKFSTVVMGAKTRRALIKYRRAIDHTEHAPLFQTQSGNRFTLSGLRSAILRIGKRTNLKLSPHTLRRTFATLAIRSKMNLLHLSALLGHADLKTTELYVQTLDQDLMEAHREHGPVDNIL